MSGNHYTRQVQHLESVLKGKFRQLSLLEKERHLLLKKEHDLQHAIHGLAGSLLVSKEMLDASASQNSAPEPNSGHGPTASASSSLSNSHSDQGPDQSDPDMMSSCAGADGSNSGPASLSYLPVLHLELQEVRVQHMMQKLDSCDSSADTEPYTTWLLRRATSEPGRVASYTAMSRSDRLDVLSKAIPKMGLLLGKYGLPVPVSPGSKLIPREQLDQLVDNLLERIVACALFDPPSRYLDNLMVNIDTREFEPYPEDWWKQVAQSLDLTDEQKAALKLTWSQVKSRSTALKAQYDELQQQQQQLHQQQLVSNRQFEAAVAVAVPTLRPPWQVQAAAAVQRQQQSSLQQLHDAWQHEATELPGIEAGGDTMAGLLLQQHQTYLPVWQHQQFEQLQLLMLFEPGPAAASRQLAAAGAAACPQIGGIVGGTTSSPVVPAPCCHSGTAALGAQASRASPDEELADAAELKVEASAGSFTRAAANRSGPLACGVLSPAAEADIVGQLQLDETEEVLLQDRCSKEGRQLEKQMRDVTEKLKVLHLCQALQVINFLTKKQLATMYVQAHPFVPDILSIMEACDELEW